MSQITRRPVEKAAHKHKTVRDSQASSERGRERIPSRFYAVRPKPDAELELANHEIMT